MDLVELLEQLDVTHHFCSIIHYCYPCFSKEKKKIIAVELKIIQKYSLLVKTICPVKLLQDNMRLHDLKVPKHTHRWMFLAHLVNSPNLFLFKTIICSIYCDIDYQLCTSGYLLKCKNELITVP